MVNNSNLIITTKVVMEEDIKTKILSNIKTNKHTTILHYITNKTFSRNPLSTRSLISKEPKISSIVGHQPLVQNQSSR